MMVARLKTLEMVVLLFYFEDYMSGKDENRRNLSIADQKYIFNRKLQLYTVGKQCNGILCGLSVSHLLTISRRQMKTPANCSNDELQ